MNIFFLESTVFSCPSFFYYFFFPFFIPFHLVDLLSLMWVRWILALLGVGDYDKRTHSWRTVCLVCYLFIAMMFMWLFLFNGMSGFFFFPSLGSTRAQGYEKKL